MAEPSNVVYPIPLREGAVIVRIHNLPDDLTRAEARKIGTVLLAMAENPAPRILAEAEYASWAHASGVRGTVAGAMGSPAPQPAFWESGGDWTDDPQVAEGWMLEVEAGTRSGVTPLYTHPSGVPVAQPGQHTHTDPRLERAQQAVDSKFRSATDGVPGRGEVKA